MKHENRDKLISCLIGAIVTFALIYGYSAYTSSTSSGSTSGRNFDPSTMSQEQLDRMATRAGITSQELKKRLDAGESMRDIMGRDNGNNTPRQNQNSNTGSTSQTRTGIIEQ